MGTKAKRHLDEAIFFICNNNKMSPNVLSTLYPQHFICCCVVIQLLYNHSFILHREFNSKSSELILCFIAVSKKKESENEKFYFVLNTTILLDLKYSQSRHNKTNFNLFMKVVNYELRSQTQTNT